MRTIPLKVLLVATFCLILAPSAGASTAYNLAAQRLDSDSFDNYDFVCDCVSSYNVDQPVTLFFANNASKDKVYSALYGFFPYGGSTQSGRLDNGFGWFYAHTGGKKSQPSCNAFDTHYRIYGDPSHGDRMWSPSQGYYVIGTTHLDYNEGPCSGSSYYGWNENAESSVATNSSAIGWSVWSNLWGMSNANSGRWDGCCHYFNNDANAAYISVP